MSRVVDVLAAKSYSCHRLNVDHLLIDFECGHGDTLADWLARHALPYQQEDLCAVWVMSPLDDDCAVHGYFTLSSHVIALDEINRRDRREDPGNGNRVSSVGRAPAQLLGKFAVDTSRQGSGLATLMMLAAYDHFLASAEHAASKYLVIEAREPKIVSYYERRYGFVRSTRGDELTSLYRTTAAVRADVERATTIAPAPASSTEAN